MNRLAKILLTALAVVFTSQMVMAQTSGSNSPYSRYGLGTLADEAMGFNKGMAGVALGMRDSLILNRQNPAAYSTIGRETLIFDVGMSLQNCMLKSDGKTINAQNATVDYVAAGFRLAKNLGFAIGLRPFSYVGYDFSSSQNLEDIDGYGGKVSSSAYTGEGGFRQLHAGVGWRVLKPLSIGGNINYLWGDYSHTSKISYTDNNVYSLARNYKATINAVTVDFGIQYEYQIDKKNTLTLGVTYGIGNKVSQRAMFINSQSGSSSTTGADTVELQNAFQMPNTAGVGLTWNHEERWVVGADYTVQFWDKCRFPGLTTTSTGATYTTGYNHLRNRHKVAVGLQYVPNPKSFRVRDHIAYRAGVSYTSPYTKVGHGKDGPEYYLVSAGVAIPIVNKYTTGSLLNISAQWEHADASDLKGLKEDYFRLSIGLTFNATWFSKWKFE